MKEETSVIQLSPVTTVDGENDIRLLTDEENIQVSGGNTMLIGIAIMYIGIKISNAIDAYSDYKKATQ